MKYKYRISTILSLLLLFCLSSVALAQKNKKAEALEKANKGIALVDENKYEEGMLLLQEAAKLDPQNINYQYELGYTFYLQSKYQEALAVLEPLLKHPKVYAKIYQLLGNIYDNMEQDDKAIETYETGLKKFPQAGNLFMEMGLLYMIEKDYANALAYFEKGIEVDPVFASNYYWAAKIYSISSQKVWGIMYGELFMNMERRGERTSEISKLLYDTYKTCIVITSDSSVTISFNSGEDFNSNKNSFAFSAYEPVMRLAALHEKTIDLHSLNRIRTNFIDLYFKNGYNKAYPNVLFDYLNEVKNAGQLETYNYWLLSKGDEPGYSSWYAGHEKQWTNFVKWYNANKLPLSTTHKFYRTQY